MSTEPMGLAEQADERARETIQEVVAGPNPFLVVDSPPGAGKTWLVERVVAFAAGVMGLHVGVVTPRAEQAYDLVRRLLKFDLPALQGFVGKDRHPPPDLMTAVGWPGNGAGLSGQGVVVATPQKLSFSLEGLPVPFFDLLVVDEAYQLAMKDFMPIAHLAEKALLVGDPGQLDPLVQVDTKWFEGQDTKVHWSAPRALLEKNPETRVIGLPASRRLVPDTTEIVQPAFYPDLPFSSLADPSERRITFGVEGISELDRALMSLADGASVIGLLLPPKKAGFEDFDEEVAWVMAQTVQRLLQLRVGAGDGTLFGPEHLGVIDPHVASGETVTDHLRGMGLEEADVNTPEQWQGRQRPLTVVKHPLTEMSELGTFNLDPGRWCVSLSRHTSATIFVGRASIETQLEEYVHPCGEAPSGGRDELWRGFRAHQQVWASLRKGERLFSVDPRRLHA